MWGFSQFTERAIWLYLNWLNPLKRLLFAFTITLRPYAVLARLAPLLLIHLNGNVVDIDTCILLLRQAISLVILVLFAFSRRAVLAEEKWWWRVIFCLFFGLLSWCINLIYRLAQFARKQRAITVPVVVLLWVTTLRIYLQLLAVHLKVEWDGPLLGSRPPVGWLCIAFFWFSIRTAHVFLEFAARFFYSRTSSNQVLLVRLTCLLVLRREVEKVAKTPTWAAKVSSILLRISVVACLLLPCDYLQLHFVELFFDVVLPARPHLSVLFAKPQADVYFVSDQLCVAGTATDGLLLLEGTQLAMGGLLTGTWSGTLAYERRGAGKARGIDLEDDLQ